MCDSGYNIDECDWDGGKPFDRSTSRGTEHVGVPFLSMQCWWFVEGFSPSFFFSFFVSGG